MKERPILFNGEMVRAILAGAKTQTRRVIKPQPVDVGSGQLTWKEGTGHGAGAPIKDAGWWFDCPYGQPGDRLWVRETWALCEGEAATSAMYRATFDNRYLPQPSAWRPSIFMPRWASRIMLEITSVRVERVQDISETDAQAEGVDQEFRIVVQHPSGVRDYRIPLSYRGGFANLWDSINEKRGYGWESNAWVWALTFRPVEDRT